MDEMIKTSRFFPLAVGQDPLYADTVANVWDIRECHDQDGYGLALRFDYGEKRMQVLLSDDDAETLGRALVGAGCYARARNHIRRENN